MFLQNKDFPRLLSTLMQEVFHVFYSPLEQEEPSFFIFPVSLNIPSEFFDINDRTILTNTLISLSSFLYTTEASTNTASHLIL